ncbi:Bug family tripartite tricarboxylate transporter substrate binding protein [Candidimonas humi]|uniref:Bug family tripartite tricarboxylate transporter substrate binding protein n=1 Tax=Candidimonas humi TaxID=683355 RepID=A0ABV8P3W6_9BURK|nr:tripartite tricarboxylate transporter substrate binding protein [Candidimonas humi]
MKFTKTASWTLICAAGMVANAAQAGFPDRPLTIVVPTAPGGGNDAMARILAKTMGTDLGQAVVVENKPGANGAIASSYVARAKPDGYTILFGYIATHAINPAIRKVSYDPVGDFAPIGEVATSPTLLVVNDTLPVKTVPELIAYSKQAGAHLNYASAGTGTAPHAAGELFKLATGAVMQDVPYKGSAPAMMDTISGVTQVMFPSLFTGAPQIKSGRVRGLAVVGEKRSPLFSSLPTLKELGVDVSVDEWYALFAPARTPPAVVARLNKALSDALHDPEVARKFSDQGATVQGGTPQALSHLVKTDLAKWKKVVAATHMSVD